MKIENAFLMLVDGPTNNINGNIMVALVIKSKTKCFLNLQRKSHESYPYIKQKTTAQICNFSDLDKLYPSPFFLRSASEGFKRNETIEIA